MALHRLGAGFVATLVVVAALAGIATADASATNLCSEAPNAANECPAGKAYGVGQVFETEAVKTKLVSNLLGATECGFSDLKMQIVALGLGLNARLEIGEFKFVNCTRAAKPCEMKALPVPANALIARTVAGNGTVTIENPAGGAYAFEVTCGGVACEYQTAALAGVLTGGSPADIVFAKRPLVGAVGCGAGQFTAEYETTKPEPLWATN